jgi:hypothetical protein
MGVVVKRNNCSQDDLGKHIYSYEKESLKMLEAG